MARPHKLDQPPEKWDRLFAPSSCLAMIITMDRAGRPNAASYGTCTRVAHGPVDIAFTANVGSDNANNIAAGSDFTVNLPRGDVPSLEAVRVVGLNFAAGVSEIEKAGLTALPARLVAPPRIAECPRHFECRVQWTKEWANRVMIVGRVVAASVDADCVDGDGYILWDKVRPAVYCGAPYGGAFAAAHEVTRVGVPYEGPELEAFLARERAMLAKH